MRHVMNFGRRAVSAKLKCLFFRPAHVRRQLGGNVGAPLAQFDSDVARADVNLTVTKRTFAKDSRAHREVRHAKSMLKARRHTPFDSTDCEITLMFSAGGVWANRTGQTIVPSITAAKANLKTIFIRISLRRSGGLYFDSTPRFKVLSSPELIRFSRSSFRYTTLQMFEMLAPRSSKRDHSCATRSGVTVFCLRRASLNM